VGDRRRRLTGVRARTTAAATAVVGVALVAGAVVLVVLVRLELTDNVQTAAELRASDVVAVLESGDRPTSLAVDDDEGSVVQVLDRAGTVVAASANVAARRALVRVDPGDTRTVDDLGVGDDGPYRVVARSTRDGAYTVVVGETLEPVAESTEALSPVLGAGIPAMLVLVAATTWTVTGRALRPVESIRREVAAISSEDLGRRVPVAPGDDEIARLARTMNAMLDRLEASGRRQRRFVSDASHELRSPIATVRHELEVAMAHPDDADVRALAADLLAEAHRMERLVDALLVLARADEGSLDGRHRPVDLDDLALDEAARLRHRGRVRVDTTGVSAGRVEGDAAQLGRLVRNLTDNAERHAASVVTLAVTSHDGHVELAVGDDGPGVPAAERERIFERFTRLDDARARDTGGAGLGLAIVAEVARAHGATVRVEDAGGARFVVSFPAGGARPRPS
jgi:signal transduction histidine kinase